MGQLIVRDEFSGHEINRVNTCTNNVSQRYKYFHIFFIISWNKSIDFMIKENTKNVMFSEGYFY